MDVIIYKDIGRATLNGRTKLGYSQAIILYASQSTKVNDKLIAEHSIPWALGQGGNKNEVTTRATSMLDKTKGRKISLPHACRLGAHVYKRYLYINVTDQLLQKVYQTQMSSHQPHVMSI